MRRRLGRTALQLRTILLQALLAAALWAAWLGWDQHRDVHPDGTTTGPYEAWQVIGLVLTLLVPLCWSASRQDIVGPVAGITAGLTVAALYDWSDDASGLFVIGVGTIMVGSLVTTSAIAFLIASLQRNRAGRGPRGGAG
ncbi:hypothetical protein ACH4MM_17230 [Streptomyces pratensis]|uniref:hypothetical protein n=1 Tax=Streptomyces pratensis TaxID=1169025 RepID=UPI00379158D8